MLRVLLGGCCVWMHVLLQAQHFNARHDLFGEGQAQTAWGVEVRPDSSAVVFFNGGYFLANLYYSSGVSSVVVSPQGNFSEGFRYHVPERANYPGWANTSSPRAEGGYIIGGSTYAAGDTNRVALYWMDDQGAVTYYRELDLPGRSWIGRQAKQTPEGGYVVCGETSTVGVIDAFLVKTDALGEVEWVRTYGLPTKQDYLWTVDLAPWGGFYLGGSREIATDNYDQWIVRVDELGFVLGQDDYGTPENDLPVAHVTTASDGSALLASAWGNGVGDDQRVCLFKVDVQGAITWEHMYGPGRNTALFVVQEIPSEGDLVAAGWAYNASNFFSGLLLRTTSTGDSLWMREYVYYDDDVTAGKGGFYDVQPTPDGGFIAVGVALGVAGFYGQDVWVVKVDSMGCLEPGCDTVMGITTQITNLRTALVVAPNPVLSGSSVQVELALPQGFAPQGALRITITDAQGGLVREEHFAPSSSSLVLSTSGIHPGLYHLHMSDNTRWISGAKLVVD